MALDDVITPVPEVSETGRLYYYDRVADMGPQINHDAYLTLLTECGFTVIDTVDLTGQMRRSYELASETIAGTQPEAAATYRGVIRAIDLHDLGWASFVCRSP